MHIQIGADRQAGSKRIKRMEGLSREKPQIWLAWLLKKAECWNFPGKKFM